MWLVVFLALLLAFLFVIHLVRNFVSTRRVASTAFAACIVVPTCYWGWSVLTEWVKDHTVPNTLYKWATDVQSWSRAGHYRDEKNKLDMYKAKLAEVKQLRDAAARAKASGDPRAGVLKQR